MKNKKVIIHTKEKYEDYDVSFDTIDEILNFYENNNVYIVKFKNSTIKIDKKRDSVWINTNEYNITLEKILTVSNLYFQNLFIKVYTKLDSYYISDKNLIISYDMYDENFNFLNKKEIIIEWS